VILRLTAVLAVALGLLMLAGFLHILGKAPWSAPEMRHMRVMKDRTLTPDDVSPFVLADFQALPHDLPLEQYVPLEERGVSFDGYVQRLLTAPDGDIHLELVATPRRPDGPDTAYVSAEITPQWRRGSERWTYENLVADLRPNHGGATAWDQGPRRVRISGWLLYDFQYDLKYDAQALLRGARTTGWEIHPVTRIELWDDTLGRFADLPR
jgi:hypothetical protein